MIPCDAIINSLEEAILLFDKAKSITYLNRTAEELFGKGAKEVVGKKFSQIVAGEKSVSSLLTKTLAEGRSFREKSVILNIGRIVDTDVSLSPLFVNGKTEGAVLTILENIAIADREDYDIESIDYVIGSIAHEIKNPLGGIKGAAQLLQKKTTNSDAGEYLDLILRETDRLNSILSGYLTVCRKPAFNPVNIHEVLEKAISVVDLQIKKADISLKRSYDPSLPDVKGDDGKLLQVFLNIIKNAIESMQKGGKIEIATSPSKGSVRERGRTKRLALISIKDSGKGISEEELPKVFLPFYTRKKQGTGLGLAVSKKIVKDHGGVIRVESEKDKGSVFLIYLPFQKGS